MIDVRNNINLEATSFLELVQQESNPVILKSLLRSYIRPEPRNEEAILKQVYSGLPSLTPEQINLMVYTLMECVETDQNLCAANAIKEFKLSLKGRTRIFFEDLISLEQFPELILAYHGQQIELPNYLAKQIDPYDSPTIEEINTCLEELSIRMHLENGKAFLKFRLTQIDNQYIISAGGESQVVPIKAYLPEELERFKDVIQSEDLQMKFASRYQKIGVKQIAIITHGNLKTIKCLENLISSIHKFGNQEVTITVFDDLESSTLREPVKSIDKPENIQINYHGWQERSDCINALTERLGSAEAEAISAAIGPKTGIGGNRNYVALALGQYNYLSLDDDISPIVEYQVEGELSKVTIDILGIASRHVRAPDKLCADFRYAGDIDVAAIASIETFLMNPTVSDLKQSWRFPYNSQCPDNFDLSNKRNILIYDHRFSNAISGGAVCFASGYNGMVARLPTIVSSDLAGRNEDLFLNTIPDLIIDSHKLAPHIYSSAATAIQHNREYSLRNTNLAQNAVEEVVVQFMSFLVFSIARNSPTIQNAIHGKPTPFGNLRAVITELSKEILFFTSSPLEQNIAKNMELVEISAITFQSVYDLLQILKGEKIASFPGGSLMSAQHLNLARVDSYQKLLTDTENVLKKLFNSDYQEILSLEGDRLDQLIFKTLLIASHETLNKYGQTLAIWSEMLDSV